MLGIADATAEEAARLLDVEGLIELWHEGLAKLDARVDTALGMWRGIIAIFEVEILETVLRGTDYCRFRITKESANECNEKKLRPNLLVICIFPSFV